MLVFPNEERYHMLVLHILLPDQILLQLYDTVVFVFALYLTQIGIALSALPVHVFNINPIPCHYFIHELDIAWQ